MDKALPAHSKQSSHWDRGTPSSGTREQPSHIKTFSEADSFLPALKHMGFLPEIHQSVQITCPMWTNSGIICIISDMKLMVTSQLSIYLLPGGEEVLMSVHTLSTICISPKRQLQICTAVPLSRVRFLHETCVCSPQTPGEPAAMPQPPWTSGAQVTTALKMQPDMAMHCPE